MYDVIIIGGGPAGLTAAIYTCRRSLKTLLLTRDIGGQAAKTFDIENYPGVPHTSGPALCQSMKEQAVSFGCKIKLDEVKKIIPEKNKIIIESLYSKYETKTLILAFGKQPRELNVPGEERFKGRGVSYCATCDIPFFKKKNVAIIGGGSSALDAANLASKVCSKVYLIHYKDRFVAEQVLIDKIKNAKNIKIIYNTKVKEILGENTVTSITLDNDQSLQVVGVVVEVGHVIDRSLIENLIEMSSQNQVVISPIQETSIPGIFAAGDLTTTPYKQVIISAGEGAKAALSAYDYIQQNENKRGISADWGKNK